MKALPELPVHPSTGLTAIGLLDDGRPVWPVLGGAPDDDEDDDGADDEDDDDQDDGDGSDEDEDADTLGDKGKQALNRMKEQRNAAKAGHREVLASVAKALGTTPERLRAAVKAEKVADLVGRKAKPKAGSKDTDEEQVDADAIRAEAEETANAKANTRIVRADLKAAATGKLADPTDAALYIDLSAIEVDEDGETDEEELAELIDALLERKPHLAAVDGGGKPKFGAHNGGVRGSKKKSLDEEIAEAEKAGNTKLSIHLKSQKLARMAGQ